MTQILLSGYTYPSDGVPYVTVNTNQMGQIDIYFAKNQIEYLTVDESRNIIISSYSSTLYGYASNDIRISWSPYSLPTYTTSGSYQTQSLTITDIVENHLTDYSTTGVVQHNYQPVLLAMLGGVILLLFFKK